MQFDPFKTKLPITEVVLDLKVKLAEVNTVILEAPPGAGKSTLIPLILKDEPWLKNKKILMLEPRRLAVKTIAERMSSLLGEDVGNTIGYRIRFESRSSANTKVEIITEGILTRMLQNDNALDDIGLIIFDEFHERNIHSDLALALTRESQNILRPDLKILVMSATLNTDELTTQLEAPLISSKGREYPISVNYETDYPLDSIAESAAFLAKKVLNNEQEGDILIFLPGEREISRCVEVLKSFKMDIVIRELFGRLTLNKQRAAILKDRNNKRKVVVATSIAETSLTIEGIKIVIDSGYTRTAEFDAKTGLSGLKTKQITKDIADQRAGRAGRLGPGIAYRMWSLSTQNKLNAHRLSEILIADLAPLKLELTKWGIQNVDDLFWLDPPPEHAINMASELLESIDAIENNKITDHGVLIQKLPTHPRIAHLLIVAESLDLIHLATDIAALLDERDPLKNNPGIDISYRIEALRRHRKSNSLTGKFKQIERLAKQYRSLFNLEVSNDSFDPFDAGILLIHAYPERIAFARPGNNAQFQLANGKYVSIGHKDSLAFEPWLAIAHMNDREKSGTVFLAAPLNPMDLRPFLKEIESYKWDADDGGIIAELETRIGSIVLKKTPIRELDDEKIRQLLVNVLTKDGKHLLNFDHRTIQLINRVVTIQKWFPNENWPNYSLSHILSTCSTWLSPYLNDITSTTDLKKLNIYEILFYNLSTEQQKILNKIVPEKIELFNNQTAELVYQENGSTPVLPIKIQSIFGVLETPSINDGKVKVLLHILSPGFKPVQITSDLPSFWKNTYSEVRKELRIRYKKHYWPENPFDREN